MKKKKPNKFVWDDPSQITVISSEDEDGVEESYTHLRDLTRSLVEALDDLVEDANVTLQQLGGGRAMAMIGGTAMKDGSTLVVKFKAKAKNKAKIVNITLDASDTYTMEFMTNSGKVVSSRDGLYAEDLRKVFEKETGLYLSL